MNRRPQGLEASKAVIGFLQYKGAEGLAPVTVAGPAITPKNLLQKPYTTFMSAWHLF